MFNYDLLEELQFWRDFLSDSSPRIVFPFEAGQHIIVSNRLMESDIEWPGIPDASGPKRTPRIFLGLIRNPARQDGGGKGSRTPDLLIANETLYQLSYTPSKTYYGICQVRGNRKEHSLKTADVKIAERKR